jgi:hypothetical protein
VSWESFRVTVPIVVDFVTSGKSSVLEPSHRSTKSISISLRMSFDFEAIVAIVQGKVN